MPGARNGGAGGDAPRKILFGRRKGRALRPGQRALLEELLPRLRLAVEEGEGPIAVDELFGHRPAEVWLEIGFGGGEHLAELAAAHREIGFIGCEPYQNGVVRLLGAVQERKLDNIRIVTDDARLLLPRLPDGTLGRVFILFPDPWPKRRHGRRRIVCEPVLTELSRLLAPGGELRIATDDPGYQAWILDHMRRFRPTFEWLAESVKDCRRRPPDWPPTRYEAKALRDGRHPLYLRYRRRKSAG